MTGLTVARTLKINRTRFTALLNGYLEVQQRGDAGRLLA